MRTLRADEQYREQERQRDTGAHRAARSTPEFRTPERQRDASARASISHLRRGCSSVFICDTCHARLSNSMIHRLCIF